MKLEYDFDAFVQSIDHILSISNRLQPSTPEGPRQPRNSKRPMPQASANARTHALNGFLCPPLRLRHCAGMLALRCCWGGSGVNRMQELEVESRTVRFPVTPSFHTGRSRIDAEFDHSEGELQLTTELREQHKRAETQSKMSQERAHANQQKCVSRPSESRSTLVNRQAMRNEE